MEIPTNVGVVLDMTLVDESWDNFQREIEVAKAYLSARGTRGGDRNEKWQTLQYLSLIHI